MHQFHGADETCMYLIFTLNISFLIYLLSGAEPVKHAIYVLHIGTHELYLHYFFQFLCGHVL